MPSSFSSLPATGRILGVDPGSRRIGLALSDPLRVLARPLETVTSRGERRDLEALLEVVREHQVVGIVVGLPRNMDGSEGPAFQAAAALLERLRAASGLPVWGFDERWTTVQAERTMIRSGARRSERRRKGAVDRVAAALILEAFLAAGPPPDVPP